MNAIFSPGMTRTVRCLSIALLMAVSGACFTEPKRTAFDPRTPLRDALRVRAERLMAGDVEGFLQYLNPLARAAEEPIAHGAITAEVSSLEFIVGESEPAADGGLERVEVEWVYRYRGVPADNVFRFRRLYRTEPRGNSILIVDSTEDPAEVPPLWASGPVVIARSPHFLVLTRPDPPQVPQFQAAAEEARVTLLPKLEVQPLVPDDVHVVVLARNSAEYEQYLRRRLIRDSVAQTLYTLRPSGAENREMVVDGAAVLGASGVKYEDRAEVPGTDVVRHELGHLVLAKFTGETTPAWVSEGAAMYLSGERRESAWRAEVATDFENLSLGRLRSAAELYRYEYPYANAAVLYLIERFNAKTFWEFYQSIRRTGVDVGLTRFYRTQDDRLDALVQEWIRKQVAER